METLDNISVTLSIKDLNEIQEHFKLTMIDIENQYAYIEHLEQSLNCFFTGNVPDGATLNQILLAQWGRKRIEAKSIVPRLLQAEQFL